MSTTLHRLATVAAIVTFCVIILGAYVRLSHAGLGCPDWPGCYGELTWPNAANEIQSANEAYPDRPVEFDKAWKEMIHRYMAGFLVILVATIALLAWRAPLADRGIRFLATAILGLILFQAALGMWTVTLKLMPLVVMAHLLGGMTTFTLLTWLAIRTSRTPSSSPPIQFRQFRPLIIASFVVLSLQIALGGWTSANYSALACPDFPVCHGSYWPEANYVDGFTLWREIGVDYEGGILDLQARVAIHWVHRLGAVFTFLFLGIMALKLLRRNITQRSGLILMVLLLTQVTLGILNVTLYLPLPNAVAHNGVAALLLAQLVYLLHRATPQKI